MVQNSNQIVLSLLKHNLLSELLPIVQSFPFQSDLLIELFITAKSVIYTYDISEDLANVLSEFMLQKSLLIDTNTSDLALSCVASLLRNQNISCYEKLVNVIEEEKEFSTLQKLLECIQEILKESQTMEKAQGNLVKSGVFGTFKTILARDFEKESLGILWKIVFQCIRCIVNRNYKAKTRVSELDFKKLAVLLMQSEECEEICRNCEEIVLELLFENEDLEIFHEVVNAQCVPCVVVILSMRNSVFSQYLLTCLDYSYNATYFSMNSALDIALEMMENFGNVRIFEFLAEVVGKILMHNVSPLQFKRILRLAEDLPSEKQLILIQSLTKSTGKCFVQCDSGENCSNIMLNPTEYHWFYKPSSHIKLFSDCFGFIPKKEFTIITWVQPSSKNLGCLAEFVDKKAFFRISFEANSIELRYFDKKTVFVLKTPPVLLENQWNLVCISFQQITKFISSQNIYEITVNNRKSEFSIEGKSLNIGFHSNTLYLGNSQDLKSCLNGKISLFYISNKALSDFAMIYSLIDHHRLPFIAESSSIFLFPTDCFADLTQSEHFQLNLSTHELIEIQNYSEIIKGTDIISVFISIGGLESLFPLFKSSNGLVTLELLMIIANFSKSMLFASMIPQDFFDILAKAIENTIRPSEELLEVLKQITGRLGWNTSFQAKSFRFLLLNSKIWDVLPEQIQENYLGTLTLYVNRHLLCGFDDCYLLYSHLLALDPLPIESLIEIFAKIMPRTLELKNFDGILYLFSKMSVENSELFEAFLKELANCKISKFCLKEFTNLLLYYIETPNSVLYISGLLALAKPILEVLVKETRVDLKIPENPEIFTTISSAFDRKLIQNLSQECILSIISISLLSYSYSTPSLCEKFSLFIDLITSRIPFLSDQCIKVLQSHLTNSNFCSLITARSNFPEWLITCYYTDLPSTFDLGVALFSLSLQGSYLHKLRNFLLSLTRQNINKALVFYNSLLEKLMKINAFHEAPHYFLDFCAIFEDILSSESVIRAVIDPPVYICIVISLMHYSLFLKLVHCTFPPLPRIDFTLQYELLKEKPMEIILQPDIIYQREGGFIRLILKFIFIGLQFCQSQLLITALKIVLRGGQETEKFPLLSQKSDESPFADFELERFSIAYPQFPVRNGDMLYTEEFICLYTLAEITEILNSTADQGIIDFALEFLQNIDATYLILNWSKKISTKELEDLYRILKDFKQICFSTARSRLVYLDRSIFAEGLKNLKGGTLGVFQSNVRDQALSLEDAKGNEGNLRNLLISPNWIFRVHVFLIAFTSMKVNFVSNMVKIPGFHLRKHSAPDLLHRPRSIIEDFVRPNSSFIQTKLDEIKNLSQSCAKKLEISEKISKKKLDLALKFYKKVENIFEATSKFRIRWRLDSLGRIATLNREKVIQRVFTRKKTVISAEPNFKSSNLAITTDSSLFETFVEESEFSGPAAETEEETIEENVPELLQSIQIECEKIKVVNSIYGELEISQEYLIFISEGKEKPSGGIYFGSSLRFMQETKKTTVVCPVEEISEVFPRRYIHKHTGFEVYLRSGKSYFFNVFTMENREKAFTAMKSWKHVKIVLDLNGAILRALTKKWKRCEMSNLEYLLILNKFASRSFHDLSQYPIFPWVLKDYTSEEFKVDDPAFYRNFKLPIGAQTDNGRQEAEMRFSMSPDEQNYHFGSHYSSGAIVLHYLVRLEPFSSLSKSLQGGSFDIADRLFHSIEASWESGQGGTGDVKELIPELFYLPELLTNFNKEKFGFRQDGEGVEDVKLPKWALNSVDFIRKHAMALESHHVSQNLQHWIDLVFGVKQRGKNARGSFNLFYPMSYEENYVKLLANGENENFLQGMVEQVVHFGQTPVKLFARAHPVKDSNPFITNIFDKYRKFSESTVKGCQTNGEISGILLTSRYLILVKHLKKKVSILKIALNQLDEHYVVFERKKEKFLMHSDPGPGHSPHHYALLGDNRIISGNHLDNSLKVHLLTGKLMISLHGHTDLVTCVASVNNTVISACKDASIFSWKAINNKFTLENRYQGHISPVVQVCILNSYQMLFSLASSGHILVHDIRTAECLHGIRTDFIGISLSSLKLIGGFNLNELQVIDLQGDIIWKKHSRTSFIKFDQSGTNFCYCGTYSWGFFNIFEDHKKYEKIEDNRVNIITLSNDENYFLHSEINEEYSFVFSFQVPNKDIFLTTPGINF